MYSIKRELKIFLFLFFLLSLAMHYNAWLEHPIMHLQSLEVSNMGWWHPFAFTLGIYILILFLRSMIKLMKSIGKKLSA